MYRIAVLAEKEPDRQTYAQLIARHCSGVGLFPQIAQYAGQEAFFEKLPDFSPTGAVVALPGVAGLNAVEHLRSLLPTCRIIWCSDLDFSLQAFRLRVEYFILAPVTKEALEQGLTICLKGRSFH